MARDADLKRDLRAYIAGDEAAGNRICEELGRSVRNAVSGFLSLDDLERDDVVQESLFALLKYLRKAGVPPDNPEAFAATIARNRCRNLHHWRKRRPSLDIRDAAPLLASEAAGPLDILNDKELRRHLRGALDDLDPDCARLLEALYLEERPVERMRRETGLKTVQGVYYRKYLCLKKLSLFFNRRLFGGHRSREKDE